MGLSEFFKRKKKMSKVRMLKTIRGGYADFYKDREYEIDPERAAAWIKLGKCVAVDKRRPTTRRKREAAVVEPPETAMEETTTDESV